MKLLGKINLNSSHDYIVFGIGILSFVYLLNPTLGIFEFVPDNIPFLGNVDEGVAVFLIFSALKYFGYDVRNIFKKEKPISTDQIKETIEK
jgi:hypothetical protein